MWVNPQYAIVKDYMAQSKDSDSALASVASLETMKATLVDKENSFNQADLDKLKKLLPDNVDNIRWFLDIQGIASRYGVTIQDISVADQAQKTTTTKTIGSSGKPYGQMALSFSVSTSYENLISFLKDLEQSLRIVEIKSLSFTADNKTPDRYKVSLGVNAFWLNPKTATTLTSQ
jgi:Tfp pilus assembly protein PilO